jgi:hypothetical protein
VGDLIGIPAGNTVKKEQLQGLVLIEHVQSVILISVLHALTVVVMYGHIATPQ